MKKMMSILMGSLLVLSSFGCQSAEVPGETKEKRVCQGKCVSKFLWT